MAIRFACAQCGKIHRVPDHYAGRRGTCGRCGYRFTAPGTTPDTSNVFVASDDSDDLDDVQLMDRPPKRWAGVGSTLIIGLLVGLVLIACMFLIRDGIVSAAPGLAPLLPPKANPPRRVVGRQPEGLLQFDHEAITIVVAILSVFVQFLVLVVLPLTLPGVLSRFRVLSVGRWLIMAGVCCFFVFTSGVFLSALFSASASAFDPKLHGPGILILFGIASYAFLMSFFGIPGCMIGAALYPKDPPQA